MEKADIGIYGCTNDIMVYKKVNSTIVHFTNIEVWFVTKQRRNVTT